MSIGTFIEHLLQGQSPIEQYLLSLLKRELAGLTPDVGTTKEIGEETIRALNEKWVVKLVATRES